MRHGSTFGTFLEPCPNDLGPYSHKPLTLKLFVKGNSNES